MNKDRDENKSSHENIYACHSFMHCFVLFFPRHMTHFLLKRDFSDLFIKHFLNITKRWLFTVKQYEEPTKYRTYFIKYIQRVYVHKGKGDVQMVNFNGLFVFICYALTN